MARTMSGISSGGGDVKLAGDNEFTGTNTFNDERPTTNLATTQQDTEFITKGKADASYTGAFLQFTQLTNSAPGQPSAPLIGQKVTVGLPPASNPNQYGGVLSGGTDPASATTPQLKPSLTLKSSTSSVIIDVNINGEWRATRNGQDAHHKQMVLVRQDLDFSTGSRFKMLYGATNFGNRMPTLCATIDTTNVSTNPNGRQFLNGYKFRFVDDLTDPISGRDGTEAGDTINYQAVLTNGISEDGYFTLNRTSRLDNDSSITRGMSNISLTEVEAT